MGTNESFRQTQLSYVIAVTLAALIFLSLANLFPIVILDLYGRQNNANLIQAVFALFVKKTWFIGAIVLLTTIVLPFLEIVAILYIAIPLYFYQTHPPHFSSLQQRVIRLLPWIRPWSMIEVLFLGVIVSMAKLQGFANIIPGVALWALLLLMLAVFTAFFLLKKILRFGIVQVYSRRRARQIYNPNLNQCWAFLLGALAFYIPANYLAVMETRSVYAYSNDTIYSGVVYLWDTGSWGLAIIIFFTSIVVPFFKILALALLLICVQFKWIRRRSEQLYLYRVVELIGRWSMLDIFVVTILASLVQLQGLGQIEVAAGAGAFAAVVIFTMLAAQSFDPRWLLMTNVKTRMEAHKQ